MKNLNFNILFIMRCTRPKKNGLAPIYARITTGGQRQELYTQCDGNPESWDQKKERALGTNKLAMQVNETLHEFRAKIMEVRRTLQAEGYEANALQIKRRYLNPLCDTLMLIDGLADYCKRRQAEVGVRITQRTADKYDRLLRYLKEIGTIRETDKVLPHCTQHPFASMTTEHEIPIQSLNIFEYII